MFTGVETEDALVSNTQEFFAIGRLAAGAGFSAADERLAAFARQVWTSFAGGDASRSLLPVKAAFPATELTTNIFALSFALQNQAFFKYNLCSTAKNLHESLMMVVGARDNMPPGYVVSLNTLCCTLCEIAHCILDTHWADPICCFGDCLPIFADASKSPKGTTLKGCFSGASPLQTRIAGQMERLSLPLLQKPNGATDGQKPQK